ncbi:DUF6221 family protein [Streptomyces griseorubiginosus]|uniref:DUF6221 family protein n=1 Tax=Streptomyces griseorubiginosus TaxID=67304 RepID=UPI0036432CCF
MHHLTPTLRALADAMSDVSEHAYCAGWLVDTEYEVWRLLHEEGGRWGQAGPDTLAPLLDAVRAARRRTNFWIVGDEAVGAEQAITYEAWRPMYEKWAQRRQDQDLSRLVAWIRDATEAADRIAHAACWDAQPDVWTARPAQASYERYTIVDHLGDGVVAVTPENADQDGVGQHIALHDPHAVLRRVAADRRMLDDLLTEHHTVSDDPFYTCPAATEEREGETNPSSRDGGACDCGRDARVYRRVQLLAEGYGWSPPGAEETSCPTN